MTHSSGREESSLQNSNAPQSSLHASWESLSPFGSTHCEPGGRWKASRGPEVGPRSTDALEIQKSYTLISGVEHRFGEEKSPLEDSLLRKRGSSV